MENREYLNNLFDIYKNLLTKIEQETFINYYGEDLTLSEIAENRGISKSSVGKTLNNVEDKLKQYEESLKIFSFKLYSLIHYISNTFPPLSILPTSPLLQLHFPLEKSRQAIEFSTCSLLIHFF